jgi:hypothetical protein
MRRLEVRRHSVTKRSRGPGSHLSQEGDPLSGSQRQQVQGPTGPAGVWAASCRGSGLAADFSSRNLRTGQEAEVAASAEAASSAGGAGRC